jgi:hypothetical protein
LRLAFPFVLSGDFTTCCADWRTSHVHALCRNTHSRMVLVLDQYGPQSSRDHIGRLYSIILLVPLERDIRETWHPSPVFFPHLSELFPRWNPASPDFENHAELVSCAQNGKKERGEGP